MIKSNRSYNHILNQFIHFAQFSGGDFSNSLFIMEYPLRINKNHRTLVKDRLHFKKLF